MVRKGGFEPPRLSAPPPQDGVSASSTTSAEIVWFQTKAVLYQAAPTRHRLGRCNQMGMRGMLEQISEGQLKDFISNPRLAYRYISDPHAGVGKRKASKLELVKASNEPRKQLSLEKDWHFLHYMLNGTVEGGTAPLSQVVLGGTEIANPDGLRDYDTLRY